MAPYAFVSRVFVAVFLLFPLAARAQGFSFCTDLDDVVKAAPQHFHGIGPDAMPGAEKCGLAQAGGKASSFGCIWHLSMGDEKSGTIWISKRIERCFPKWTYKPNYNSAKGPRADFDSGKARVTVTSKPHGRVAVTVTPKMP